MGGLAGLATGDARVPMSEDQGRRAAEMRLVRAAQQGDLLAFERLYRDNERKVFGLCFRLSSDPALAEELTQDVFVRAWRKLSSFRGDSAFSSWLYPLTVNVARSEHRSRRRREARVVATEDPARLERTPRTPVPEAGFDLEKAIATLPPGARAVVRAARRRRPHARGDRRDAGDCAGHVEGSALPRAPAAAGGTGLMTCHELDERLDDYLDGALAGADAEAVVSHLAGCEPCRERERQLRQLLAHAAALPRSVAPPRDLWPGIAERIERGSAWSAFTASWQPMALCRRGRRRAGPRRVALEHARARRPCGRWRCRAPARRSAA